MSSAYTEAEFYELMEMWLVWKTKLFIVFICVVLWGLSLSWSSICVCNEISLSTIKNVFMDCREAKQMEIVEGTAAAVIPLISPRHPSKRSNWSFRNIFHAQAYFCQIWRLGALVYLLVRFAFVSFMKNDCLPSFGYPNKVLNLPTLLCITCSRIERLHTEANYTRQWNIGATTI